MPNNNFQLFPLDWWSWLVRSHLFINKVNLFINKVNDSYNSSAIIKIKVPIQLNISLDLHLDY